MQAYKEKLRLHPELRPAVSSSGSGRAAKAEKDPNMPKKPLSSYFIFLAENRVQVTKENPDLDLTKISTVVAAQWKALTPEEKKVFEDKYANAS